MVRCAARLKQHVGGGPLGEEAGETLPGEPVLLVYLARYVGDRYLEDGLCEIDGDVRSVHADSSPLIGLRGRTGFWHVGAGLGEESIPSLLLQGQLKGRGTRVLQHERPGRHHAPAAEFQGRSMREIVKNGLPPR